MAVQEIIDSVADHVHEWRSVCFVAISNVQTGRIHLLASGVSYKRRAETMVCFTAFSLKADQMPIFGLLLVFFLLKSLHFMNFPQNDE